jgi:CubicO group peptidase (beta-lactamase class C family)
VHSAACPAIDIGGIAVLRPHFALMTVVVLACSLGVSVHAQRAPAAPTTSVALPPPTIPPGLADRDKDSDARVGALVKLFASKGPFSGVVVVAREGKIISARVAGFADVEKAAPVQLETPMRLASVTKMLTAAAVLVLRDRGLVELDAPVARYLPDAPPDWSKVTVRQLLSHRSGLGDYSNTPEYDARRHRPATTDELWKAVRAVPMRGELDYSNSNYVVLGALIERVTGDGYDAAMRRLVCEPLGMTNTAVDSGAAFAPGHAVGYTWRGRLERAAPFDPTNAGASGGLRSTAGDLVRFAHALSRPGLLSDDSRRAMFDGPPDGYGFGCFLGSIGEHRLIWHGGGFDGFATYLGFLPDSDLCVVVLCNIEQTRTAALGRAILRLSTGEAVRDDEIPEPVDYVPPPRAVTPVELARYAGEYQSELGLLKFTVEGEHLIMHAPGEPSPQPLTPEDQPGTFHVPGPAQVRLRFQDNAKEPSQTVEVSVRGKVVVGTRSN